MNVVLTGFMATGKSEVGRLVAQRLGWAFYDTDEMIEKQTGLSVTDIFTKGGEASFRELEAKTVGLVALLDNAVIATGGGVPLRESNMTELEKNGTVICLTATAETILDRLRESVATRPLLRGGNPARRAEELLRARRTAYGRCKATVATDGLTVEQVAERILGLIPVKPRA